MDADAEHGLPREALEVLEFWYGRLESEQWWERDKAVDAEILLRFRPLYDRLSKDIPGTWLSAPQGRLAAVIVLDQFPRNMFRGDPRAFATDARALELAEETIASGMDAQLSQSERGFLYMPFQHTEDRAVQARSVELFEALGDAVQLDFAIKHKKVIDSFGRFPHRNEILGRRSTAEELEVLKQPGLFW